MYAKNWTIKNERGEWLMAVNHFCSPNLPVFTDESDDAMTFETPEQADSLLASHHNNLAFGNCEVVNTRPARLYW